MVTNLVVCSTPNACSPHALSPRALGTNGLRIIRKNQVSEVNILKYF